MARAKDDSIPGNIVNLYSEGDGGWSYCRHAVCTCVRAFVSLSQKIGRQAVARVVIHSCRA